MSGPSATNTLNLVGDGDELDILDEVETAFGISIAETEAAAVRTVGDLFDLVVRDTGAQQTRACLTQAAFYRLRRALLAMGSDVHITPDTPIARALSAPVRVSSLRAIWRELGTETGLKLPQREIPWPNLPSWMVASADRHPRLYRWLAVTVLVILIATFLISTGITGFTAFCTGLAFVALAFGAHSVLRHVCGTVPERLQSVGDLAREAAGRSFQSLRDEQHGFSPHDLWWALLAILRHHTGHAGPIDRETTFFAKA
jgi:hypothetical protein